MIRAFVTPTLLVAGLALAAAGAASAHEQAPPPGGPAAYCPAPPPPSPTPRPAHRHGACPSRHARVAQTHAWRRPARAFHHADESVSASQAWVYGRELALHGLNAPPCCARREPREPRQADRGPPCCAPQAAPRDLGGGQYRYERREFDAQGGQVEGWRDGRRYAWSWGDRDGRDADGRHADVPPWRRAQGGGYEVYDYAGRDERGYLVWPGKPR